MLPTRQHLSDLACQEWARYRVTRLALEGTADVVRHLEHCDDCRARALAFERMESEWAPDEALPGVVDQDRQRLRRILLGLCLAAIIVAGIGILAWV